METEEPQSKSRVVNIDSYQTWDFYINQATNEGCPVVVHFSASWCMPSVAMISTFDEIASSYPDVMFLMVDVDDVKEVAKRMEVKAMPTFLLMKNGSPMDKLVGANPVEMRERIDSFVRSTRAYIT